MKNTSSDTLKDMYVAQWCDPDLGNYSDDVVGCDPALGMGFAYNGSETDDDFKDLGLAPSAIGFDFFQGPIVDGVAGQDINNNGVDDAEDYAVFNLQKIGPGKVNMQMTSFGYFSAGNTEWDDPDLGKYDGTLQWYNLLRGYITNTDVENPTPFTHRATGEATKFPLDGDPVTGQGDIDGNPGLGNFAPADRRMSLSTGPFVMAPGDVQEVVVAIVGGKSGSLEKGSRTQSVFDMKVNDEIAQFLYNTLFTEVPKPPSSPVVKITPLENKVAINWGSSLTAVEATENTVEAGYAFEGYNVYQLPTATSSVSDGVRIATFDVVNNVKKIIETRFLPEYGQGVQIPVRFGDDTGVQRYFVVDKNYLNGEPLHPGNTYYFAVTAYNYNANAEVVKSLESSLTVLPVTTQSAMPGKEYKSEAGDLISISHEAGVSDGQVQVTVIDPGSVTGHDYEIFFTLDEDTNSATYGEILWGLKDVDLGTNVLENQPQAASIEGAKDAPIADGMQIRVAGPVAGFKAIVQVSNAGGALGPDDLDGAGAPYGGNNVWHSLSAPSDGNRFYLSAGGGSGTMDRMARSVGNARSHDFELRFTSGGGYYLWWYDKDTIDTVPFEAWDVGIATYDDPSDDIRMLTGGYSGSTTSGGFSFKNEDPYFGYPATDWVYMRRPLNAAGSWDTFVADITSGTFDYGWWAPNSEEVIARLIICDFGGAGTLPEEGTVVRFITNKLNGVTDVFKFSAPAVEEGLNIEKEAAKKVTVYPNPYYADNARAANQFDKYITFYHLTKEATIRIFDLAGHHVRKLEKNDDTQFLNWNLENASGLPVASGIYFAHVEMKLSDGSKVTKVLKIFIIQRAQIIKYY